MIFSLTITKKYKTQLQNYKRNVVNSIRNRKVSFKVEVNACSLLFVQFVPVSGVVLRMVHTSTKLWDRGNRKFAKENKTN